MEREIRVLTFKVGIGLGSCLLQIGSNTAQTKFIYLLWTHLNVYNPRKGGSFQVLGPSSDYNEFGLIQFLSLLMGFWTFSSLVKVGLMSGAVLSKVDQSAHKPPNATFARNREYFFLQYLASTHLPTYKWFHLSENLYHFTRVRGGTRRHWILTHMAWFVLL